MLHCVIYCMMNDFFIYLSLQLHIYASIQFCESCLCYKMNCGWDFVQPCEMCHKQHYAIMPKRNCISLPLALEETVLPSNIADELLDQMFIIYSLTVQRAIRHIIGEEFLCPSTILFFYLSQLISIFLSNAMDLM